MSSKRRASGRAIARRTTSTTGIVPGTVTGPQSTTSPTWRRASSARPYPSVPALSARWRSREIRPTRSASSLLHTATDVTYAGRKISATTG